VIRDNELLKWFLESLKDRFKSKNRKAAEEILAWATITGSKDAFKEILKVSESGSDEEKDGARITLLVRIEAIDLRVPDKYWHLIDKELYEAKKALAPHTILKARANLEDASGDLAENTKEGCGKAYGKVAYYSQLLAPTLPSPAKKDLDEQYGNLYSSIWNWAKAHEKEILNEI